MGKGGESIEEMREQRAYVGYAVYAVLVVQILAWIYISQDPTPRLKRKSWLDMVIYGGYTMDAVALIGTNRGLAGYSMVPWIVAAVAKLVNLVMESIYGAVGHYTLFIVSLVFTHWGIFCLLAWSMFIASELGEEVAKAPPPATGPGSASYAAGGTDPQEAASSAKLMANAHKVLGWIPVLGGLLGRVEQSQKRQMTTSV